MLTQKEKYFVYVEILLIRRPKDENTIVEANSYGVRSRVAEMRNKVRIAGERK